MDPLVEEWVDAAAAAPARSGIFVDFDGTLSPIVDDPASAAAHPGADEVLGALSRKWGLVAVISGRPVSYLSRHLAGAGDTGLYGLYGLERGRAGTGETAVVPEAEEWRAGVAEVVADAQRRAPAGVGVEAKGLTVTLHYRAAPTQAGWVERFAAEVASARGLVAHAGKMSVEIRPPVEVDKGTVVRELAVGLDAVLFVGDDLGDLPAFAELARLRAENVMTLGVASAGGGTPAAVLGAADVVVDGPAGVIELLRELV